MLVYRYDKTFEGLLTAIFEAYNRKERPERLLSVGDIAPMFTSADFTVCTDSEKSSRVWNALEKKISKTACRMLWCTWLSELEEVDDLLFRYICKAFDSKKSIETNFADQDILRVSQLAGKVLKESERIRQFVRFQKASDDTYFAPIAPMYNALPLTLDYFTDRFADQKWVVYDTKRKYGYYYDLRTTVEITLEGDEHEHLITGKLDEELMAKDEKLFQQLWKSYFKAMAIKERINPKLHRQHLPQRFWKYLPEKQ